MLIEPLLVGERAPLLEIGSRAEGSLTRAGEHDAAMPLLGLESTENVAELERGLGVESVGDLGAVEGHQENRFRPILHPQGGVLLHACSLRGRPAGPVYCGGLTPSLLTATRPVVI